MITFSPCGQFAEQHTVKVLAKMYDNYGMVILFQQLFNNTAVLTLVKDSKASRISECWTIGPLPLQSQEIDTLTY